MWVATGKTLFLSLFLFVKLMEVAISCVILTFSGEHANPPNNNNN